ncbi:hypothetical protein RN001_003217 [Aquatica leii]|uniref:Death domain-containing protein n=1 Tax=Aquatica leii TaxID=1421715 RepID=A0AAN7PND3_9COLE|nr:hypothetical protein RN001_003217 [Aquatica leii]
MTTAMGITNYDTIRSEILHECNQCSNQDMSILKHMFAKQINSIRRLDNIRNVHDLVNILEKRNVLNSRNFKCFQEITAALNINKFDHYFGRSYDRKPVESTASSVKHNSQKEQIYELICNELGIKWKDFARALEISDAKIDEMEERYRLMSERIRKILMFHENSLSSVTWLPLLEALSKSRRNDLRIKIETLIKQ